MRAYECALAESVRPTASEAPVLTVVIPTYFRPAEMAYAVSSIARQVRGDLEGKVEILVTDNASGPETAAALHALSDSYPCVGYMIHEKNEGGAFQVYAAPFRARGRWVWVFGDDDALAEGGLARVVELLETEAPAFMTLNRQLWTKDLRSQTAPYKHTRPDTRYATFMDLLAEFGFDQLSFLSSQVYEAETARQVDTAFYVDSLCAYGQLAYYLEAFHDKPAVYSAQAHVQHRWDAEAQEVHARNFHQLATFLPMVVGYAGDRVGLPEDFFETIGGRRSLIGPETRRVTFVDNILENLWRCAAVGTVITEGEWDMLRRVAPRWRPDRAEELDLAHTAAARLSAAVDQYRALAADLQARAAGSLDGAQLLEAQQLQAVVMSLRETIQNARAMAVELSRNFQ